MGGTRSFVLSLLFGPPAQKSSLFWAGKLPSCRTVFLGICHLDSEVSRLAGLLLAASPIALGERCSGSIPS